VMLKFQGDFPPSPAAPPVAVAKIPRRRPSWSQAGGKNDLGENLPRGKQNWDTHVFALARSLPGRLPGCSARPSEWAAQARNFKNRNMVRNRVGFSCQATHLFHGFRKWDFLLHSRGDQSLGQSCAVLDDIRRRRLARAEIRESPRNRARQHGKHPGFVARQIVAFRSLGN
jgi:hypothetical protein